MKTVSTALMRELDSRTINEFGVPGAVLMDRAGRGVADFVRRIAVAAGTDRKPVLLVAGRGNNGGDAFVAARYLVEQDFTVQVLLAGQRADVRGDALLHLEKMTGSGAPLREMPAEQDWQSFHSVPGEWGVVVDGVLGTGLSGPPRGVQAAAIGLINRIGEHARVVAIDVPSGLDADNGIPLGDTVLADFTVTMGFPKTGFTRQSSVEYVGSVEVVDIGIPESLVSDLKCDCELVTASDVRLLLPRRKRDSHKGTYGHVLVIAGSSGFSGAAVMALRSAICSGAGLVSALVPRGIAGTVAASVVEAMVHGCDETRAGSAAASGFPGPLGDISKFDAVLVGPGMTACADTRAIVEHVLSSFRVPVIVDADAINVQKAADGLPGRAACPTVMTPHPGEMAKYLGIGIDQVQKDRIATARRVAEETGSVVVLKGAGTVIAARGAVPRINSTGNPGMASGGMGDVLGGIAAVLAAQGIAPLDAASAATYIHGLAGDRMALAKSQVALSAGDVIKELPVVLRELCGR